jgi:hypothetical protein
MAIPSRPMDPQSCLAAAKPPVGACAPPHAGVHSLHPIRPLAYASRRTNLYPTDLAGILLSLKHRPTRLLLDIQIDYYYNVLNSGRDVNAV